MRTLFYIGEVVEAEGTFETLTEELMSRCDEMTCCNTLESFKQNIEELGVPDEIMFRDFKLSKECIGYLTHYCFENESPLPEWGFFNLEDDELFELHDLMSTYKKYEDESKTCLPSPRG